MQILSRVLPESNARNGRCDDELDRLLARVLRINPCLQRAHGHEEHLRAALASSAGFLNRVVSQLPLPRVLNAQSWASDPCLRAFFDTTDQVAATLANARELTRIFQASRPPDHAYAVLAMEMAQSTPHLRACQTDRTALQKEIVDCLVDQLALEALGMIVTKADRRDMLECELALFSKRVAILKRLGIGMGTVVGSAPQDSAERRRLEALVDGSDHDLRGLGLLPEAFERQVQRFCSVLLRADRHIRVGTKPAPVDRSCGLSAVASAHAESPAPLTVFRIADNPSREFAATLVRVAMVDMPRPMNACDQPPRLFG
ncbi:hypothetical protein [Variovorax ginsengisoli]|uniref:Uncharacterized protein n=1 Tax=Variovorax ginsengisoli TaxID=363844 RepID=A0ABT8S972_9BURK|nr:hypothetical protein [Variovorax ginsengisoli]MDN8615689.1 hypothetical protein [Variovorax ginsengisoli]MDO1534859.1 hypothetical protein [Variovorax ginsengisoli]